MSQLFELSASLTLDAEAFLSGIRDAEAAARSLQATLESRMSAAAAATRSLGSAASSTWASIAGGIAAATASLRTYLSLLHSAGGTSAQGFATGLDYVPYNNFPARLHEGEAVLTKLEAAQWRKGSEPAAVDLSGLGESIAAALSGVTVEMDGQAVGTLVAPSVNRLIALNARARRYG